MSSTVLFIDDELQWLDSGKRLLVADGYDIVTATNASDAIKLLETIPKIDLVLTDLMLPEDAGKEAEGATGIHLLELIRSKHPEMPIIVVSGYLEAHAKDLGALGVSDFISKGSPDFIDDLRFYTRKALLHHETKVTKETVPNTMLAAFRELLIEEIDKYSPLRERTIHVPQEGKYELIKPLIGFKGDIERQLARFPFSGNVFLMMKFRESNRELGEFIIESLDKHELRGVRADNEEWNITKNVYNPIAVMYCCKFGIALFDEAEEHQAYSPNVAYELGMMHYQNKHCLILRHKSLPIVPFDLIKDLYVTYERDLQVRQMISSWIKQVAIQPENCSLEPR